MRTRPSRAPSDASDFEVLCAEWMQWFGIVDVRITDAGPDGGVDVRGAGVIAQAKFYSAKKVSEPEVRDLIGCKTIYKVSDAWFFSYGPGFTDGALELGLSGLVDLFRFDAASLAFKGETVKAACLCELGVQAWNSEILEKLRGKLANPFPALERFIVQAREVELDYAKPRAADTQREQVENRPTKVSRGGAGAKHVPTRNRPTKVTHYTHVHNLPNPALAVEDHLVKGSRDDAVAKNTPVENLPVAVPGDENGPEAGPVGSRSTKISLESALEMLAALDVGDTLPAKDLSRVLRLGLRPSQITQKIAIAGGLRIGLSDDSEFQVVDGRASWIRFPPGHPNRR